MKKFLLKNSKLYRKLENRKIEFGKRNDLEYLFKPLNDKRKKDYDYYEYIKEIDVNLIKLKDRKIKTFLDICAAPGRYSKYIYDTTKAIGHGITLYTDRGCLEFKEKISNYKLFFSDINSEDPLKDNKYDFIVTGCLDMTLKIKKPFYDVQLWLSALILGLNHLKKKGIIAFKVTTKYINLISNFIFILLKLFDKIILYKSSNILGYRSFCYIIGFGYRGKHNVIRYFEDINKSFIEGDNSKIIKFKYELIFDVNKYGNRIMRKLEPVFKKNIIGIGNILSQ